MCIELVKVWGIQMEERNQRIWPGLNERWIFVWFFKFPLYFVFVTTYKHCLCVCVKERERGQVIEIGEKCVCN